MAQRRKDRAPTWAPFLQPCVTSKGGVTSSEEGSAVVRGTTDPELAETRKKEYAKLCEEEETFAAYLVQALGETGLEDPLQ